MLTRSLVQVLSAALAAAPLWIGAAFAPTVAAAQAPFACHAFRRETCHFAVLSQAGRLDFVVPGGQSKVLAEAVAGRDKYMVTVNISPPQNPSLCRRVPGSGRRSTWCKLAPVGAADND
jgi:hypothetical protein